MSAAANTRMLEVVLKAIPYPALIRDIDLSTEEELRFTWRGARYRVSTRYHVEEVHDGFLSGSDASILLERALRLTASQVDAGHPVLPA